jgi:CRISPR-associated protein Cmr5
MIAVRTHTVATSAYAVVLKRQGSPFETKYGALAHKLPGLILQNGLAQATGFLLAKGKDEHLALLADLGQVLHAIEPAISADGQKLHQEIIGADLAKTMRLTRRTLEVSGWLKRYVQGVLGVDATGETKAATDPDSQIGKERSI